MQQNFEEEVLYTLLKNGMIIETKRRTLTESKNFKEESSKYVRSYTNTN